MSSNQIGDQTSKTITNKTSNIAAMPGTPKAQTAKELIAANAQLLIEQREARQSKGLVSISPQWDASTTTACHCASLNSYRPGAINQVEQN